MPPLPPPALRDAPVGRLSSRHPRTAPLRLGIVGCGAVAERYHLPAILASTDVTAAVFVDAALERAQALASQVRGAHAVRDHRALLEAVDLAVVTTPNALHAPIAADLLSGGVHVLVEKPMARTVAECDVICDAARAGGAVVAVGHDFRFFPIARAAHELLRGQPFGPVVRVDVRQSAGVRWPCVSPEAVTREAGGGVLLSFGVHTLDLLLWWLGPLTPLSYRDDAVGGVEAECEAEFATGAEVPVHLEVTRRRSLRDTTIIECERATIEIGVFEPAFLRVTFAPGMPPLESRVVDAEFDSAPLRTVFARQLRDVVSAIDDAREPLVTGEDGRRAVELIEGCYAIKAPLRRPWDYPEAYAHVGARVSA